LQKSPTAAFCAWTEDQIKMHIPSFDDSPTADIDILAERNFECLMEYDAEKEEKLNFWQQARLREEEEIKKINFEEYLIRQAEIEAEEL